MRRCPWSLGPWAPLTRSPTPCTVCATVHWTALGVTSPSRDGLTGLVFAIELPRAGDAPTFVPTGTTNDACSRHPVDGLSPGARHGTTERAPVPLSPIDGTISLRAFSLRGHGVVEWTVRCPSL